MKKTTKTLRADLQVENLEDRLALSLTTSTLSGGMIYLRSDNAASNVYVSRTSTDIRIQDLTNGFTQSYNASLVNKVQYEGGAGNDRFVNLVSTLPVQAWGYGGNDYLEGFNGKDTFVGGDGNDILKGYGGNDSMWGGNGDDVLLGMDGDDSLVGSAGNDQVNGGAGSDHIWGGTGRDVLISLDSGTWDYVEGNEDRDIFWKDSADSIISGESQDVFQNVSFFSNGADRSLNGDRITDPTALSGHTYKRFSNNPLFGASGPKLTDIQQGGLGDCYFMAALGAVANDNSFAIRSRVVDFNDGTYGVRFGSRFYRVDNDLPVSSSTSTSPAYAKLGASNSMWVAVMEKAFAHFRTGGNTYASIENGWSKEVNAALGSTSSGGKSIGSYSSASAMANDIFSRWNSYQAVTVGFTGLGMGVPLVDDHMYTVVSVQRNSSGVVTSITLRNPWGTDGVSIDANPNDGLIVVTPAQIFSCIGQVNWGRV